VSDGVLLPINSPFFCYNRNMSKGVISPHVSVFTPSHNPQFLDQCWGSLKAQTFKDFEWVVGLNAGAKWVAPRDKRIVKVQLGYLKGVGEAKALTVAQCRGEILVELDHDDEMASNALELIKDVFDKEPEVGFVYSNCAQISEDGSRNDELFDLSNGWEYYEADVDGRSVLAVHAMEPTPHNVSYVWYGPNHIRAWRRSAYDAAGGYNVDMEYLDDQDLMARTYQKTSFFHIPRCLYLQRCHSGMTQRKPEINAAIQTKTVELYDRDIQANALAWAQREGLRALDLGGAHNPAPGFKTVDMVGDVDYKGDIFEVLGRMKDSSVGVVRASDFLEHVADKVKLFNELYRVLAHGGLLLSCTPSTDGRGAHQDPTHVAFYNENSHWYWSDANYAKFVPEIACRFQVSRLVSFFPTPWHRANAIPYVQANLIAVKDGSRQGGRLLI